jgi:hypothetical protein
LLRPRRREEERGSSADVFFRPDASAMTFDDAATKRETDAGVVAEILGNPSPSPLRWKVRRGGG